LTKCLTFVESWIELALLLEYWSWCWSWAIIIISDE